MIVWEMFQGLSMICITIIINSLLSNVLDHQVAADVKGDFLSNFLYILIIFKWQIHKDDVSQLNFVCSTWNSSLTLFSNEHFKVLLFNKALITINSKWLKSIQTLRGKTTSCNQHWKGANYHFWLNCHKQLYGSMYIVPNFVHVGDKRCVTTHTDLVVLNL